jgi:putative lipoic acid-binding regulatory protein
MSADKHKPLITYPCRWDYKIIGADAGRIRAVIAAVVTDAEHTVADSNRSRGGKYCSVALTVTVRDEAHRNQVFMALRGHRDVIMVL